MLKITKNRPKLPLKCQEDETDCKPELKINPKCDKRDVENCDGSWMFKVSDEQHFVRDDTIKISCGKYQESINCPAVVAVAVATEVLDAGSC